MEEQTAATTTYWCHTCSRTVTPVDIKCPFCLGDFVEEMVEQEQEQEHTSVERSMDSILTPIFVEMMNNSAVRNQTVESETDLDSQLQEILRRRGRSSVSLVQLLQGVRAGLTLAPDDTANNNNDTDRERGRVIVINPYNQIVGVPSSAVSDTLPPVAGSLSEYFIGPGFEALLERLAESDPSRYGTPPACKDAVETLASVEIQEVGLQCSVCLDDFETGTVGKQMPCNHSFHCDCLLPWLELHSSCPVCRYQLPTNDETSETNGGNGSGGSSSTSSQGSENSSHEEEEGEEEEEDDPMAA